MFVILGIGTLGYAGCRYGCLCRDYVKFGMLSVGKVGYVVCQ